MDSLIPKQRFKFYLMMNKKEKFARRSAMGLMREEGKTLKEIGKITLEQHDVIAGRK